MDFEVGSKKAANYFKRSSIDITELRAIMGACLRYCDFFLKLSCLIYSNVGERGCSYLRSDLGIGWKCNDREARTVGGPIFYYFLFFI